MSILTKLKTFSQTHDFGVFGVAIVQDPIHDSWQDYIIFYAADGVMSSDLMTQLCEVMTIDERVHIINLIAVTPSNIARQIVKASPHLRNAQFKIEILSAAPKTKFRKFMMALGW